MDNFSESEPGPETSALYCANKVYELILKDAVYIVGKKRFNSSLITKGNRNTVRMSFEYIDGSQFSPADWQKLIDYASVYFSDLLTEETTNGKYSNLEMMSMKKDPDYDNKQTIIISTKE